MQQSNRERNGWEGMGAGVFIRVNEEAFAVPYSLSAEIVTPHVRPQHAPHPEQAAPRAWARKPGR